MTILVIDVGTSSVRAVAVRPDATLGPSARTALLPETPFAGLVEVDAVRLGEVAVELACAVLAEVGRVDAIGITNQRATTIVWDAASGRPVGPGLGWQDLRTVGACLALQGQGIRVAPNASATKLAHLLDEHDPQRRRDLRFGTVDTWIAHVLTDGALHVTDPSNAAVTGLLASDASGWDPVVLEALRIPEAVLPRIVDTAGPIGEANALPGAPAITALVGDQQASLAGQGCVVAGQAKITFGTGAMLDVNLGSQRPGFSHQGGSGCFPIVSWRRGGELSWGAEAVMLSAGSNVEWLRDDLGLIDDAAHSHDVAQGCESSDGVVYVPALLGLGAPYWDHGARSALFGLTRGSGRAEIVRAVLEGVAHRGADLVDAARADTGASIDGLRVDGGMSTNATFVQALADASQLAVQVSPVPEATSLGAGLLAGLAVGTWSGWDDVAATWSPARTVEPGVATDRQRWADAVSRASRWHPELSTLSF